MTSPRSQILLDNALLCISSDDRIIHASQSWEHFDGLEHAALLERGLDALILAADLPLYKEALARARELSGQDVRLDCVLANRTYTHVEWVLSADAAGTVYASARRFDVAAQDHGLPSALLLEELLDSKQEVVSVLNPDTSIRFLSDANSELLGYSEDEFLALPIVDHIHPEDRELALGMLETLAAHQKANDWLTFEYRIRHKHGHWVSVVTTGKALRSMTEVRGFLLITRGASSPSEPSASMGDASRAKRLELEASTLDPRLEILSSEFAASRAAIDANFAEIHDYITSEASPRCLYEEDRTRLMFSINPKHIGLLELPPYEPPVTEVLGSSMLRSFDHELRTPLNNIRGYTELLLEELEEDPATRGDLKKLHTATRSLQRLLDNLVELTRLNSGDLDLHFERLTIDKLLEELGEHIELMLDERGVQLELRNGSGRDAIYTDRERLLDALVQLIAFFAPRASGLSLEVVEPSPTPSQTKEDDRICFELTARDYGSQHRGLARALTGDVDFEGEASQREHLDVYMAARRFELLGGGLTMVDDDQGGGVTLCGFLPLPSSDLDDVPMGLEEDYESEVTGDGPVILLIDGDVELHNKLNHWLAETDYQIEHAHDGIRGLQIARELMPTLIILDVVVPRLDGWSILSSIRKEITLADTPVLILSMIEDRELAHALGATDLMQKPPIPSELIETIERLLPQN